MSAKRGPYRKCYLVPHRTGFKYCRAVPKDLQSIEGKQAWVKYLGPVSRAVAETMAHALAYDHGRRILALRGETIEVDPSYNGVSICSITGSALRLATSVKGPTTIDDGSAAVKLGDLVGLWERVRAPRSAISRARSRLCARRFIDLVGNLDAQAVRRADAVAYRDSLENLSRLKPRNVADHLGRLHVLFTVAMSEGLLDANPFQNVRPRHTEAFAPRRLGFTAEHVGAIFAALKDEPPEFCWIVKLLAYHGMRSGEACQLRCDDIAILHGVPVLRIHDRHGSVKNRVSVRDVPIHPACMAIQEQAASAASAGEHGCFHVFP